MADRPALTPLTNDDWFIRRNAYKNGFKVTPNGVVVAGKVFRESHGSMSLTRKTPELKTEAALKAYQLAHQLPSGDLPGLCSVSFKNLVEDVPPPPLQPRYELEIADDRYGHLHYVTEPPDWRISKRFSPNSPARTGSCSIT